MRPVFLLLLIFVTTASAGDFVSTTPFASVEAFAAAAKAFHPSTAKGDLAPLFVVPEEAEDHYGELVSAKSIQSCQNLWSDEDGALLLILAAPDTEATRSVVGVVFLLVREDRTWRIADLLRVSAVGKYAGISAEQTADAGNGLLLSLDSRSPVITLHQSNGGRGYGYEASVSYRVESGKLKRLDLK